MKNFIYIMVYALMLTVSECNAFDMLIQTGYKNTPDFSEYGFSKSTIIYEQQIYSSREKRNAINRQNIDNILSIVRDNRTGYVILDIEYWLNNWNEINYFEKEEIIGRYKNTINELRANLPNYQFGYYGVVPAWAHWNTTSSTRLLKKWLDENEIRRPIIESVDVIYPNLYTYHKNPEDWKAWATLILNKAKEMAKGRKIIPFIWPNYHESSVEYKKGGKELPLSYWRMQMEFLKINADGFVIWNGALGSKGEWNNSLPWWVETQSFIRDNFPDRYRKI